MKRIGSHPARRAPIASGLDLIALFVATVAQADGAILVTGGLASVILVPAFWIWTGRALRT